MDGVLAPFGGQGSNAAMRQFLVGPENRLVKAAVQSVLEGDDGYNPLVLYGPSGTGKSHLAHGIAVAWRARAHRCPVLYETAIDFARELDDAIEAQAMADFREHYLRAALLVMEDIGRLAGRHTVQLELVALLDELLAAGVQVVLTAAAEPEQLPGITPRLRSRLVAGLTVPVALPGLEARLALLQQAAGARGLKLTEAAVQALAAGLRTTVPGLLGAVVQLEMEAPAAGGVIEVAAARQYVERCNGSGRIDLRQIAAAAARLFGLRVSDLRSASRRRVVVRARGVAMYLARELAGSSLNQIGDFFGGRDHTTVMHGCRRTEELLNSEPAIRQAIQQVRYRFRPA